MKIWLITLALLAASSPLLGDSHSTADGMGELVILATGFKNSQGQAGANLFLNQDSMFDHPHRQAFAKIIDGKAEIRFPDLPYGDYALVVFHDENQNGRVDHNFFNFPSEPLGYSNGFSFGLTSGMPTFEKLRIHFNQDFGPVSITVD